ncbi:MAG: ferrous iron transport protein A [Planctomycetes bacterium]|nr:ferrous iron transport protein A [Planctomycetota bacterium]
MVSAFVRESPRKAVALAQLAEGIGGVLLELQGSATVALKLAEAGFVPGARVRLVRRAPLGSPLEVEIDGARFSLRAETAALVMVQIHA